ncbi:MAG: DUF2206 domain-containing protein [Pyrinomonadaceae bacterium]|nr:DUF2206 domain-containing protein [Pyrinomonadaceae bacterium]
MSGGKEIRINVIKLALIIQLAVFGLICLDKIGIFIPVLRQCVVFFYLTFIPGMLILRLRDIDLNLTKTLLLSFGLSLAFVTLLSTFVNVLLASTGFERPISETPLLASVSISVLLLIILCHFKGNHIISFSYDLSLPPPSILSLLLLPLVSILASYASSFGESSLSVLFLLALIALVPLIVSLNKLPEKIYPLVILASSISLVFLRFGEFIFKPISLYETGIAGVVKTAGIWDPSFPTTHNSLLYLSIFHPTLSILTGIDILTEVMLIGFLIVILLPLILYELYRNVFDSKTSLLASFLFLFYPFHNELLGGRAGFAILFLASFFLTLFSKEIAPALRKALLIVFAFSIITSHYGTAYYFMLLFFVATAIALLLGKNMKSRFNFAIPVFCSLYFVLALSWYLYTSASVNVNWMVDFGKNVYLHLSEFLNPESSATIQAIFTKWAFAEEVTKWLLLTNTFFICTYAFNLLLSLFKKKSLDEYHIFAMSFSLGLVVLLLPRIMGTVKIYAVSLVLLAPFSFLGFSLILKILNRAIKHKERKRYDLHFSIFLLIFLLFGSGFVSGTVEILTNKTFDPADPINWWPVPNQQDVYATEWLLLRHANGKLYVDDVFRECMFVKGGGFRPRFGDSFNFPLEYAGKKVYEIKPIRTSSLRIYLEKEGEVEQGSYVYLGYHNTIYNFIGIINEDGEKIPLKTDENFNLFIKNSKIYDNGISSIWFKQ